MARLNIPNSIEDAPQESRSPLEQVGKRLGFVPNLHRLIAVSPDALSGVMQLQAALSRTMDARTRDSVALAVSQANGCDYCLCAHSHAAATFNGFSDEEIALAREGKSSHPGRHAAAAFARRIIETRGHVSDDDLQAVRCAGFNDRQIVELVALSVQFLLTNFMNNAIQTPIDFPQAEEAKVA